MIHILMQAAPSLQPSHGEPDLGGGKTNVLGGEVPNVRSDQGTPGGEGLLEPRPSQEPSVPLGNLLQTHPLCPMWLSHRFKNFLASLHFIYFICVYMYMYLCYMLLPILSQNVS